MVWLSNDLTNNFSDNQFLWLTSALTSQHFNYWVLLKYVACYHTITYHIMSRNIMWFCTILFFFIYCMLLQCAIYYCVIRYSIMSHFNLFDLIISCCMALHNVLLYLIFHILIWLNSYYYVKLCCNLSVCSELFFLFFLCHRT